MAREIDPEWIYTKAKNNSYGKEKSYGEKIQEDNEKFKKDHPDLDWHTRHAEAWED